MFTSAVNLAIHAVEKSIYRQDNRYHHGSIVIRHRGAHGPTPRTFGATLASPATCYQSTMPPSITDLLDAFTDAFNRNDLDAVMAAFADDAEYRPGGGAFAAFAGTCRAATAGAGPSSELVANLCRGPVETK
jgi:hypothetical protein